MRGEVIFCPFGSQKTIPPSSSPQPIYSTDYTKFKEYLCTANSAWKRWTSQNLHRRYLDTSSSTAFNYLHIGATYLTQDKCVLCSDGFPAQVFNYINYKRNCELKYSPIVSLWSVRTYAWLRLSIVPSRFLVALTSFKRFTFEKTPRCVSHPNNHPLCTLALSGLASLTALL